MARALLFERLVDLEPRVSAEPRPLRTLDADGLRASVIRELHRLLNTRCSKSLTPRLDSDRSVVDYGIPDFSSFSSQSSNDRKRIAKVVSETIAAFEPRLKAVKVHVLDHGHRFNALQLRIDARLETEWLREPVSFPITLDPANGGSDVSENG